MRRPQVVAHESPHRRTFTQTGMSAVFTSVGHQTMPNIDHAGYKLTHFDVFHDCRGQKMAPGGHATPCRPQMVAHEHSHRRTFTPQR